MLRGLRKHPFKAIIEEMQKKQVRTRQLPMIPLMILATLAIGSSFAVGMKTSGNVQTVAPLEASGTRLSGDINNDGVVDMRDAVAILEIERGYETATADQLLADPNSDGKLTIDDAIRILNDLSIR